MANSSVWKVDKIPTRVTDIAAMVNTKSTVPTIVYVHCTAGCDRTGEVIGSYRLKYKPVNVMPKCMPSILMSVVGPQIIGARLP